MDLCISSLWITQYHLLHLITHLYIWHKFPIIVTNFANDYFSILADVIESVFTVYFWECVYDITVVTNYTNVYVFGAVDALFDVYDVDYLFSVTSFDYLYDFAIFTVFCFFVGVIFLCFLLSCLSYFYALTYIYDFWMSWFICVCWLWCVLVGFIFLILLLLLQFFDSWIFCCLFFFCYRWWRCFCCFDYLGVFLWDQCFGFWWFSVFLFFALFHDLYIFSVVVWYVSCFLWFSRIDFAVFAAFSSVAAFSVL